MTTSDALARSATAEIGFAREQAGFLPGADGDRFVVAHVPAAGADLAVVICSSLYAERHRDYRREVALARALARSGIATARFHYRGTGNSGTASGHGPTFSDLAEDARDVTAALTDMAGASSTAFVGIGVGALVAAAAANSHPGASLALWKPVAEGGRYFRDLFRARLIAATRSGHVGHMATADLTTALQTHGWVDVMGFTVARGTYETVATQSLTELMLADRRRVLVAAFHGARPGAEAKRIAEKARSGGSTVEIIAADLAEDRWFIPDADQAELEADAEEISLIGETASWLMTSGSRT